MKNGFYLKYAIVLLGLTSMASCSTDTEAPLIDAMLDIEYESNVLKKEMLRLGFATFEGKWSLSGIEANGNLTVTKDSFEFVLPEKLLVQYILETTTDVSPDEPFFNAKYDEGAYCLLPIDEPQESISYTTTMQKALMSLNGLSDATGYMNFYNDEYNVYSYSITIGEVTYCIDASFGVGHAMYDILYGQWTLQFPLYSIKVTNIETGWNRYWDYEQEMILKYFTTRKIG